MKVLANSPSEKSKIAAQLTNDVLKNRTILIIEDNLACVQANRMLADWVVEMVENSNLANKLCLFIKSRKRPNTYVDTDHPAFTHLHLDPLDAKDRRKLFYNLIRIYELNDISPENVEWFVNQLLLSPYQLVKAADELSRHPIRIVKKDIEMLKSWGDRQIKPMIDHFFTDEENKIVLIVLSKMDFVSYDILKCFFEDDIENVMKIIDEMMYYGIVTIFGPNEEFFRLDHYFSDYIKRCKLRLSPDEEALFNDILEKKISSTPDITEDASVYLYEKKQIIIKGRGRANDFLIPSVVVSAVMDLYNQQKFKLVITVCYMVLNDVHNYYPDQERELRYWLCLSLARTTDKRFFDEIKLCNKNDADYYFLRGFYCRNNEEYYEAEQFYDKALWKSPSMQRAKREMVTALLAQDKYEDALEMARENYESSPENSYQIHGYFRCLVRKSTLSVEDKETLNILMKAMQTNLSDKHEELYAAMNIEYQWYINSLPLQEMQKMISEAKVLYPNSLNIGKVASEYKKYVNSEYV